MSTAILITGAMGSGKTTLLSMPYHARLVHLGKTAAIDADTVSIRPRLAARGTNITDEALVEHVQWMRDRQRDWTCGIDNTCT